MLGEAPVEEETVDEKATARDRLLSFGSGALFAAGLAILGYRYGLLPLVWHGAGGSLDGLIAVGVAGLGRFLRKQVAGSMSWAWALLGAPFGAAIAFAGCWVAFPTFERLPLTERTLPGLTVALPKGEESLVGDYANGLFRVMRPGGYPGTVDVNWEPGERLAEEEVASIAGALVAAIPELGRTEPRAFSVPADADARSVSLSGKERTLTMTLLVCGARRISILSGSSVRDPDGLHQRILASLRCEVDPAEEEKVGAPPPVAVDLPPDWALAGDANPGQLQLVGPQGSFLFMWTQENATKEVRRLAMAAMMAANLKPELDNVPTRAGERSVYVGAVEVEGEKLALRAVAFPCRDRFILGIFFGDGAFDPKLAVLADARCVAPGEMTPQYLPPLGEPGH